MSELAEAAVGDEFGTCTNQGVSIYGDQ